MALPQNKNSQNRITEQQNALDHLAQGYSVIPVRRAHDKKERVPLVKWGIYQSLRPAVSEVRAWWTAWPDANPAIVTGALSGIIALDVDGPDGLAWLEALGLPPTRTVSRGAAGRCHFWFKHPGFQVRNKTLHPQVEVKGDGGLIPCPGALHWSGAPYRVVEALDIVPCPAWLIDLLKSAERPAPPPYQPAPDDDLLIALAVDALSPARSENRDDWLAVLMALHSAGEQYRALAHTFSARCPEKYQPRVVDQTWQSFKRSGITIATLFKMADADSPGWRPKIAHATHTPAAAIEAAPALDTAPDAWPEIIPYGIERLLNQYTKPGQNTLIRGLMATGLTGAITPQAFAEAMTALGQPLTERQARDLLKADADTFLRNCPDLSTPKEELLESLDSANGQSCRNTAPPGQKAGRPTEYVLARRPWAEACERFYERIIVPSVIEHFFEMDPESKNQAPASVALVQAFTGETVDAETVQHIAARLAPHLDLEQQRQTLAHVERTLRQARALLRDRYGEPFLEGVLWNTGPRYAAAQVKRYVDNYRTDQPGEPLPYQRVADFTGLCKRTVQRIYERICYVSEVTPIYTPLAPGEPLPEAKYSPEIEAAATHLVDDRTGRTLPLKAPKEVDEAEHREALRRFRAQAEGGMSTKWNPAGVPRPMTDEEKEQALRKQAGRKAKRASTPPVKAPQTDKAPHYYGPGHSPRYVEYWGNTALAALGFSALERAQADGKTRLAMLTGEILPAVERPPTGAVGSASAWDGLP